MTWAPDYVDSDEFKDYARVDDSVDDTEIALLCTAASRAIDNRCYRQFGQVASPEARVYTARWDRHRLTPAWVVDIDDLPTTTGFTLDVSGTTVTSAGYTLEPRNAVLKGKPWTLLVFGSLAELTPTGLEDEVTATGSWGWTSVPSTVQTAGRLQINRWLARRDSPYGVAGSPQDGSEIRLLARLDPDVELMLANVTRWRRT